MFKFFSKDPVKKLEDKYANIMSKAVNAQRNGDMALFAKLSSEADNIAKEIDNLKEKKNASKA